MIIMKVDQHDHWTCLVRRGMLHSETEAVEHWALILGERLQFPGNHGVDEAIVALSGEYTLGGTTLRPGMAALLKETGSPFFL